MNKLRTVEMLLRHRTTYSVGLLQTKAFRILNQRTAEALREDGITPLEWAMLGVLREAAKPQLLTEIAASLDIEAPFVTTMAKKLEGKILISVVQDKSDRRAKRVSLSGKGKRFVDTKEVQLRKTMRNMIADVPRSALIGYLVVLNAIAESE